jgi:hypothetical protein
VVREPARVVYDAWDTYVAETDAGPAFVSFDAEAAESDLSDTLPHCARVILTIRRPNANGGPVSPESERLYELEDELCAMLADAGVSCRLVGRLTHGGLRELVFQLDDWDEFRPPVGAWMVEYSEYEIDVSEHEGWDFFNDCVRPSPEAALQMADRRVIRGLIEAGTKPGKPHALEFFFAGKPDGLRALTRKLGEYGYAPKDPAAAADGRMCLILRMPLDEAKISEESRANHGLAASLGVKYTGWGAAVVR